MEKKEINKRGTDQTNLTKCRWEWKRYNFPWKSVTWLLEASQPSEPSSADTVLSETIYQPTSTLYFQGVQFPWERSLRGFSLTEVGVVSSKVGGGNDGCIHKQMEMSRLIYSLLFNGHCVCVSLWTRWCCGIRSSFEVKTPNWTSKTWSPNISSSMTGTDSGWTDTQLSLYISCTLDHRHHIGLIIN